MELNMRNANVPILPGQTPYWEGSVDAKELKRLLKTPTKRAFSLGRTQVRLLFQIVFPYWENYLKAIAHPITDASILNLRFGWAAGPLPKCQSPTRTVQVVMDSHTSIDLTSEKILFQIVLCRHNVPRQCLIIHEGRGRFEIVIRDQECAGAPH